MNHSYNRIFMNTHYFLLTLEYGVSQNEKDFIVNEHNRLRTLLARGLLQGQPRAVNLKRTVTMFETSNNTPVISLYRVFVSFSTGTIGWLKLLKI